MRLLAKLWALLRSESYLDHKRSQRARDVLEMVIPSRPQVANHQRQAALHIQLANEISWKGPRRAPSAGRGAAFQFASRRPGEHRSAGNGSR